MERICFACKSWKAHKGTLPGLALMSAWGDCKRLFASDKIEAYHEHNDGLAEVSETFEADRFETIEDFGCAEWAERD